MIKIWIFSYGSSPFSLLNYFSVKIFSYFHYVFKITVIFYMIGLFLECYWDVFGMIKIWIFSYGSSPFSLLNYFSVKNFSYFHYVFKITVIFYMIGLFLEYVNEQWIWLNVIGSTNIIFYVFIVGKWIQKKLLVHKFWS